jgi:hypothetical protein
MITKNTAIILLTSEEEEEEEEEEKEDCAYWKLYHRFGHGLVSVEQN